MQRGREGCREDKTHADTGRPTQTVPVGVLQKTSLKKGKKRYSPGDLLPTKNEKRLGYKTKAQGQRGSWGTCSTFDGAWGPSATYKLIGAKPMGQRKKRQG